MIASNTYASVKGPINRGFSYIEIWMAGVEVSMLVAIIEYGIILTMKKPQKMKKNSSTIKVGDSKSVIVEDSLDIDGISRKMDLFTFFGSLAFIMFFNMGYWMVYWMSN